MNWDRIKQAARPSLTEPPKPEEKKARLNRHGEVDGRVARKGNRNRQFNPRVRDAFFVQFQSLQDELQEQSEEKVTQAYVLELLLATYRRAAGREVNPFGLSDAAMRGAELIAERLGWPLSQVLEDAIAARCRDFNIAKGK